MRHHHALGRPGRAGGVHDIRHVLTVQVRQDRPVELGQGGHVQRFNTAEPGIPTQRQFHLRVFGDELQPVPWQAEVKRDISGPGLEYPQNGNDLLKRGRLAKPNQIAPVDTLVQQMRRHLIRALVQFRIGQRLTLLRHRRIGGKARRRRLERAGKAAVIAGPIRGFRLRLLGFLAPKFDQRAIGAGDDILQQGGEALDMALDGLGVEQIAVVTPLGHHSIGGVGDVQI